MNRKKVFVAIIVSLLSLLLVLLVGCSGSGKHQDWVIEEKNGEMVLIKYKGGDTSVTIPANVTSIGSGAFDGCTGLQTVTFGENSKLKSIGSEAFYGCTGLQTVTFGENSKLESIGASAFDNCTGLTSITIPDSVTSIGDDAFKNCMGLTSITIPVGVTLIGEYAFYGCTGLQSVTFGENSQLTSIGYGAFSGCTGLTSITIPDSVTSIGQYAFDGCTGLTSITLPFVGSSLNGTSNTHFGYIFGAGSYSYNADYVPTSLKTVVITGGSTIDSDAFEDCTGLTSITIPDSVTSIGSYAFRDCTGLTSITIPESVTSIGSSAFEDCTGLTSITIPDSVTSIGQYAFDGCTGLTSITLPFVGSSLNGTSNTHLGYIFGANSYSYNADCVPTSLKTVVITGGSTIDKFAFYGCTGLTSITLPFVGASETASGYQSHFGYIFGYSSSSSSGNGYHYYDSSQSTYKYFTYNIPASLKTVVITGSSTIGASAFRNCTGLTSITIPDSVTSIGIGAFSGCTGLTSITVNSGNTVYHSAGNCLIETASKTLVLGCNTSVIPTDGSVTSIASSAFSGCTGLTSITIPDSVTSIGSEAFYGCAGPTSITIPDSVTSIGERAFEGCTGLTSITLSFVGASKTASGYQSHFGYIFGYSSSSSSGNGYHYYDSSQNIYKYFTYRIPASLKTVVITGGSIGASAFRNCTGLTSITIPDSVTSIGDDAFYYCTGMTSITIPDSVTSIGSYAFEYCTGLQSVIFGENSKLKSIGNSAFSGCTGLTSITIPDNVTWIGDDAFYYCTGLTSITIPASVTSIGYGAFYNCTGLTNITLPFVGARPGSISNTHFGYIFGASSYSYNADYVPTSLKTVVITGGSTIDKSAFYGCTGLTSITLPFVGASLNGTSNTHFGYIFGASSYSYNDDYVPTSLKTVVITGGSTIGSYAFDNCTGLTSITIPASVTSIGSYAFEYCTGLQSVTFGKNSKLKSIGIYAFFRCYGLTSITIPASVTEIGSRAFSVCTGLTGVYISDIAAWCNISFGSTDANPLECAENLYLNGELVTALTIPDSVTSIGNYAFYDCKNLTSITIPTGVTWIGNSAFSGCTGLKKVYYGGTASGWSSIIIGGGNSNLTSATRYDYSANAPTTSGNYWHYDGNGNVVEW